MPILMATEGDGENESRELGPNPWSRNILELVMEGRMKRITYWDGGQDNLEENETSHSTRDPSAKRQRLSPIPGGWCAIPKNRGT